MSSTTESEGPQFKPCFLYSCYSLSTEPQELLEGMTVNIGLGPNAINGYHPAMVISHDAVILHILIINTLVIFTTALIRTL